jgi:hypothetical protein
MARKVSPQTSDTRARQVNHSNFIDLSMKYPKINENGPKQLKGVLARTEEALGYYRLS